VLGEVLGPESRALDSGYRSGIRCSHTPAGSPQVEPCSPNLAVLLRGFTLIELLIVLLIAGLMAAFVVPSFVGSIRGMRLKGEVKHLAAALRFARSQAVCSKGLAIVKLDLDSGTYNLIIKKKQSRGRSGPEGGSDLFGAEVGAAGLGGGSTALGGGSLSTSSGLGGASSFGASKGAPQSRGKGGESPLVQLVKKKRKLKKGVKMTSFTYGDEKYEDGVCNVFFFPRGTSTGGLIELEGESGRSFVIEIEPVTGSVKIKTPEDYS